MRRSARLTALACIALLLGAVSSRFLHAQGGTPAKPPAATAWQYEFLPDALQSSFDLRFKVAFEGSAAPAMRLLLGNDEKDALFIEAGAQGIRSGRIHAGLESSGQLLKAVPAAALSGKTLVLEKRPNRWSLMADGQFLAGGDLSGPVEKAAFGARGEALKISDLRYQPVPDIYFTDTFMRTPEDPTNWTELSGTWQVSVLRNPLLSANAFFYRASGATPAAPKAEAGATPAALPAATTAVPDKAMPVPDLPRDAAAPPAEVAAPVGASIVGEWFWSGLCLTVACKPAAAGAAGFYLCYRGPEDYYLFRWTSADSQKPVKQMIRRLAGKETVLAEAGGGDAPDQWYNLSALTGCGWAQVSVDDSPIFTLRDAGLTYGKVGLRVEGVGEAAFDDVLVESRSAEMLDFSESYLRRCLSSGGEWMPLARAPWDPEAWPGGVVVESPAQSRLMWGESNWRNYRLQVQLGTWEKGSMGLVFRYQDELNYCTARWVKGEKNLIQIWRREEGKDALLAETTTPEGGGPRRFGVATDGWDITVSVDSRPALTTADYAFPRGRMGLFAEGIDVGAFSEVTYDFLPGRAPVVNTHEAFAAETSMSIWSDALSDWDKKPLKEEGRKGTDLFWRRTPFEGDVRVDARMSELPPLQSELGLVLNGDGERLPGAAMPMPAAKSAATPVAAPAPAADAPVPSEEKLAEGYLARLSRPAADKPCSVELLNAGVLLGQADLDWKEGPMSLSLMRTGSKIIVAAGGKPLLSCSETAAPAGRRVGWYSRAVAVEMQDIDIYSDKLMDYGFNAAPTDWRTGGGIWEVANKWQCDPRWSFFSGRSDGLAVLWNKRPLRGDFTIEFFVGNKMDQKRGNTYEYAQDMNISVCADGKDLTSGYSFLFGGFGNTVTCVYRQAQRWNLPATGHEILIDRRNLHRKWYHVAIARKGNQFEMRIDDKLVLSAADPEMLPEGHWAIWTYNNGLMIARVRVTAEEIGPRDSPDIPWPLAIQRIYGGSN